MGYEGGEERRGKGTRYDFITPRIGGTRKGNATAITVCWRRGGGEGGQA